MKKKKGILLPLLCISVFVIFMLPKQAKAEVVTITQKNFGDYFGTTEGASYDPGSGKISLTKLGQRQQFESFYFNKRIDSKMDFTLVGDVYLGEQFDDEGGGDGIGFTFHPNGIGDIGLAGGSLGIQKIKNATGFKLDTYYNKEADVEPTNPMGLPDDWPELGKEHGAAHTPFGGWVTTNEEGKIEKHTGEENGNFALNSDAIGNNRELPMTVEYTHADKNLHITVDGHSWDKEVDTGDASMVFHVAATTGNNTNTQYFKFKSFTFTAVKRITVTEKWVGDEAADRPEKSGFTLYKGSDDTEGEHHESTGGGESEWVTTLDNLNPNITGYSVTPDELENYTTEVVPVKEEGKDDKFVITHTYNGALKLKKVPESLEWTNRTIPRPGTILNRDDGNEMKVVVSDTRKEKTGSWAVDAKVIAGENLPNNNFKLFSLIWKNAEDDEPVDLEGQKVLDNTAELDGNIYSKMWSIDTGVLLKANDYIPIGEYKDNVIIRWTLTNAADPESTPNQEETPTQDVKGGE